MSDPSRLRTRVWTGVLWTIGIPWSLHAAAWVPGAPPAPARHVVEIRQFAYSPSSLTLRAGDTIVWVNRDMVPHTATAEGGAWDSGSISPNGSWRHVVTGKGEVRYLCALHPTMKATLTVR